MLKNAQASALQVWSRSVNREKEKTDSVFAAYNYCKSKSKGWV
jgi:hypothetical protein